MKGRIHMNRLFEGLPVEKQKKIINAALEEFTKNGFHKASTNTIVKKAGISKGALFKYFTNKLSLFYYLYEFSEQIINNIYEQIDYSITDFFERLNHIGKLKLDIIKKYPEVFNFLKVAIEEIDPDIMEFMNKKKSDQIEKGFIMIYKDVDFTKFRDDIDLQIILDMIKRIILSYNEEQINHLKSYTEIDKNDLEKWYSYYNALKKLFYK